MTPDGIGYLILKFAKITALGCDPALTGRSIPRCDQHAGFLRGLNPKYDFVHVFIL